MTAEGHSEEHGDFRVEHDSMGEVRVPRNARWGAQTQRAVENFPISGKRVDPALLAALALVKGAAAAVNGELGVIDLDAAAALEAAAWEVAAGASCGPTASRTRHSRPTTPSRARSIWRWRGRSHTT
jgi:hypothetical protein